MRVTTSSILRRYSTSLNRTLSNYNKSNEQVTSGRKYSKGSESPSEAARAYQYRKDYLRNQDYISNVENTTSKFDVIEDSMMQISKAAEDVYVNNVSAAGTKSLEDRKVIATQLRELQKTIVMNANTTYGDDYIFGGTSTKGTPFELSDDGVLTYRGIDVNSTDPADQATLSELANEKIYVDLGFGLSYDSNGIIDSSAYNTAFPGISFLGYGTDSDGDSKNLVTLIGNIADALESETLDTETFDNLCNKFNDTRKNLLANITKLGSNSKFLEYTKTRLESAQDTLNEKILDTEYVDLADAMLDYTWYQYSYNAALKVGSSILSPSFIDFMD